jgi:putative oxidoreductase
MLSILRMVTAALFIVHGTQKLFNWPPAAQPMHIQLMSQLGIAGVLETFGGLALFLGVFTRPVAFLLAGEMAVAYFQVHLPRSFFPVNNLGDNVVLFCFIFLYLMVAGAGSWSIDHAIASNRFDDSHR